MHETVVAGAARDTVCGAILTAVTLGDEDLDLGPGQRGVILGADTLLELDETLVALERNIVRHLILTVRRGRTRTRRVQEREGGGETCLFDDVEGRLEVFFGLAGEANDDVRRDRGLRDGGTHAFQNAHETLATVGTTHLTQDRIGTRLQRHVQARHDRGSLRHRRNHVVREGCGVRRGESHALNALDAADSAQQVSKRTALAEAHAVGVDVLSQQGHLDGTLGGDGLDLGENIARTTVAFLTAQVRDDAERAGVVAAHGDRHPRGVCALAMSGQGRRKDLE